MDKTIFKCNGKKYTVSYINKQIYIYKMKEDTFIKLDDIEHDLIINLLNQQYSYTYESEKLKSLIEQNSKIKDKDYIYNFLSWLENIIPLDCRDNFYRNISTLTTELNLDYFEESNISPGYSSAGGYNTSNNSLTISKNSLSELRKIANTTIKPDKFYWNHYSQTLLHELAHMSSSNYNFDTLISLCGFDTFPSQKIEDQNRGLTEGFTEIISMAGVPGTIENASGYYIEALIINQLIQIIGNEEIIKSYFSNLGIEPIKAKLNELIFDQDKSFQLFRNIELNFQIRNINEEQNVLGIIQSTLLDYLNKKIDKFYELGEHENIMSVLNFYEQFLITSEKLKKMKKNPDNYLGLLESVEKFKQLKNKYIKESSLNNEENKIR